MSVLNERIKERRIALGMTLLDVAEYLGVKEATAQRYESGEIKNIKHETIVSLAKLLKCSPAYLMGWDDGEIITDMITKNDNKDLQVLKRYNRLSEYQKKIIDSMMSEMLKEE